MCNIEAGGYGIHHGKSVRYMWLECAVRMSFDKDFSHG